MLSNAVSLNGKWALCGRLETVGHTAEIFQNGTIAIPASVPGNIELELCRAGLAPEPFFGTNSNAYRKFEAYEWCFTREFELDDADGEFVLRFNGLDCFGTVFVNGEKIGTSHNALIPADFPLHSRLLKKGRNTVAVHIASALNEFRRAPLVPMCVNISPFGLEQTRVRKPAHCWGWDIAPRLSLGGIFRSVELRRLKPVRIEDFAVVTCDCNEQEANLRIHCKFSTPEPDFSNFLVTADGVCDDSVWHVEQRPWSFQQILKVAVQSPKLWYPKHYGKQELYKVTIALRDLSGNVLDAKVFNYGIRSVRLEFNQIATETPTPDFQFYVNDIPIRIAGLNHVPCDALHSRDAGRMPKILDLARDVDVNMLRIWGGGVPESEEFYDFCDCEGILIWHDFMYGCALYPCDREFLDEAEHETVAILRERRHHASIVLWAGDNECDTSPFYIRNRFLNPGDNILTRETLPQAVRMYAPGTPYLPSSPYISPECLQKGKRAEIFDPAFLAPEQHLWGSHEYMKSDFYKTGASFVSEIGYHACPNVSTLKTFLSPEKLWPWNNDEWYHHASNPFMPNQDYDYRIRIMADQIKEFFGTIPDGVETFALASQICQAEANQYFVERARSRRKFSGILIWNLIDCWPHFSDSIVDYHFGKKLSYHYCRRQFGEFLIMVGETTDWHWPVIFCNDSNRWRKGCYSIRKHGGDVLVQGSFSAEPGELRQLSRISCTCSEQALLLIEWEFEDGTGGVNHKVTGMPCYDFDVFRYEWLPAIAALDGSFDAAKVGC